MPRPPTSDLPMTVLRILLLIAASTLATASLAQAEAAAGKAKSAVCAACHAADGNSTNPEWPKLAGQHPAYLIKQLQDFKQGRTRSNALMNGMAASLSDEDMANLAAYYAGQTPSAGFVSKEADVKLGERIYRGGNAETGVPACMSCHGPSGAGFPKAGFPALAGQHAKYTATQLEAFRLEKRSNDQQSMMRDITLKMTPKEIAAVAAYINGLY